MGKIWATCGHEISTKWHDSGRGEISTKGHTREGTRCINHQVVCQLCLNFYETEKLILKTPEEHDEWLDRK